MPSIKRQLSGPGKPGEKEKLLTDSGTHREENYGATNATPPTGKKGKPPAKGGPKISIRKLVLKKNNQ